MPVSAQEVAAGPAGLRHAVMEAARLHPTPLFLAPAEVADEGSDATLAELSVALDAAAPRRGRRRSAARRGKQHQRPGR